MKRKQEKKEKKTIFIWALLTALFCFFILYFLPVDVSFILLFSHKGQAWPSWINHFPSVCFRPFCFGCRVNEAWVQISQTIGSLKFNTPVILPSSWWLLICIMLYFYSLALRCISMFSTHCYNQYVIDWLPRRRPYDRKSGTTQRPFFQRPGLSPLWHWSRVFPPVALLRYKSEKTTSHVWQLL